MNSIYHRYHLSLADFDLKEHQFDHPSVLHGIMHTYRVMVHTLRLGLLTGFVHEARLAFFAAYIHDMARRHDGYCTRHGAEAALKKLPLYHDLFLRNGASSVEMQVIGLTAGAHSTPDELPVGDPNATVVAILKDADALDRIRLGENDLNPSFLRLKQTHDCIPFSRELYYQSVHWQPCSFEVFLRKTEKISV